MTETSYIDHYNNQPPEDIDTEEYCNRNRDGIGIGLREYEEPYIRTRYNNDKKDTPRNEYGIYPMFFDNHDEPSSVFFQFFKKFRISGDIERFEHPSDDTTEIDKHSTRRYEKILKRSIRFFGYLQKNIRATHEFSNTRL